MKKKPKVLASILAWCWYDNEIGLCEHLVSCEALYVDQKAKAHYGSRYKKYGKAVQVKIEFIEPKI